MTLCSTPESLGAALETLSGHSHVFLDCEGHSLGDIGGKLSLLNLGVVLDNDGERRLSIFLIDTLAFEGTNSHYLIPIFDIMRSEVVFKVVFDGRMDASELLHGHGVQLRNVLDLQVADIVSREKRGESANERLRRLVGFLPRHELTRNGALYSQLQKLNGLEWAMRECGVPSGGKGRVDHSKWLQRPLQPSALQYAAADIRKISLLYDKFVTKGYISQDELVRQSASYIALHAKGRPNGSDNAEDASAIFPSPHFLSPIWLFVQMWLVSCAWQSMSRRFLGFEEGLYDVWETYEDLDFDECVAVVWYESLYGS